MQMMAQMQINTVRRAQRNVLTLSLYDISLTRSSPPATGTFNMTTLSYRHTIVKSAKERKNGEQWHGGPCWQFNRMGFPFSTTLRFSLKAPRVACRPLAEPRVPLRCCRFAIGAADFQASAASTRSRFSTSAQLGRGQHWHEQPFRRRQSCRQLPASDLCHFV